MVMGRRALALYDGQPKQLDTANDTMPALPAYVEGRQVVCRNGTGGTFAIGLPVAMTNGSATLRQVLSLANPPERPFGIVTESGGILASGTGNVQIRGVVELTTGQWDAVVTSGSGGLIAGSVYSFNSNNSGKLFAGLPPTVSAQYVRMGIALSSTKLLLLPQKKVIASIYL